MDTIIWLQIDLEVLNNNAIMKALVCRTLAIHYKIEKHKKHLYAHKHTYMHK